MTVGRICSRSTFLAYPDESVHVAADRMKDENVGTLLVIDNDKRPIGIVTDRDVVLRVVAPGLDSRATTVRQIMTSHPRCVQDGTPIEDAVNTMRTLGVRRLPVVDQNERLVGILSVDDVLELVTEELGQLGRVVGLSRPGASVPATTRTQTKPRRPAHAGLERASSDLQC